MPGYLTSMAVLIEAEKWLGDVENALNKKDIFSRTKLDEKILSLAHKVRSDSYSFHMGMSRNASAPMMKKMRSPWPWPW